MPTRKHPKWWKRTSDRESGGRFWIAKPGFLFEFLSNHISISLSFGDIRVWQTDRRTDNVDHYYSWPHIVAGQLINVPTVYTSIAWLASLNGELRWYDAVNAVWSITFCRSPTETKLSQASHNIRRSLSKCLTPLETPVQVNGETVKDVKNFSYLGCIWNFIAQALRYGTRCQGITPFYLSTTRLSTSGFNHAYICPPSIWSSCSCSKDMLVRILKIWVLSAVLDLTKSEFSKFRYVLCSVMGVARERT